MVSGSNYRSSDIMDGFTVITFETGDLTLNTGDNVTILDERDRTSTVVALGIQANNGVIHAINKVLLPAA